MVTTNTYVPQRGWLERVRTTLGSTALFDAAYGRDDLGRIADVVVAGSEPAARARHRCGRTPSSKRQADGNQFTGGPK